jgi:cell division FtsZ-interacting protein ZapD
MRRRELEKNLDAQRALMAGQLDYMFVDVETKMALLDDLKQQMAALVEAELKADPETYQQLPDGSWKIRHAIVPMRPRQEEE